MGSSNFISILKSAQSGLQTGSKMFKNGILSDWAGNWNLGVFEYGEFKYEIRFMKCARSGLQTGLKNSIWAHKLQKGGRAKRACQRPKKVPASKAGLPTT